MKNYQIRLVSFFFFFLKAQGRLTALDKFSILEVDPV